jgi:integrase
MEAALAPVAEFPRTLEATLQAPPDDPLPRLITLVTEPQTNAGTRAVYARAVRAFWAWFQAAPRGPLTKSLLIAYRTHLVEAGVSPSRVNGDLSAVRKLAEVAADLGYIGAEDAAGIAAVPGVAQRGVRLGHWLGVNQIPQLLALPDRSTLVGLRDFAILGILVTGGLRRAELVSLELDQLQLRPMENGQLRWVLCNIVGKGGRIRSVPLRADVKAGIDAWCAAAGIRDGALFRSLYKGGRLRPHGIRSDKTVWLIVARYVRQIVAGPFGAHDLRRTCAKMLDELGADLRAIQALLGHASPTTTDRYIQTASLARVADATDRLSLATAPGGPGEK